jgi:hypothetical protein
MNRILGNDHDVHDLCIPRCTLETSAECKNLVIRRDTLSRFALYSLKSIQRLTKKHISEVLVRREPPQSNKRFF